MKAFIFDMDDTLFARSTVFRKAIEDILDGDFPWDEKSSYKTYSICSDQAFFAHERGEIGYEESRVMRIQNAMEKLGHPITREQAIAFQIRYEHHQESVSMSEIWHELFSYLKNQPVKMAIMTNGESSNQRRKINALGLPKYFDDEFIFISGEIGCAKPDPQIYDIALNKMCVQKEDCFMIGDSYTTDMEGAARYGLKTIWFNPDCKAVPEGKTIVPDMTVRNEKDLLEWLKNVCS